MALPEGILIVGLEDAGLYVHKVDNLVEKIHGHLRFVPEAKLAGIAIPLEDLSLKLKSIDLSVRARASTIDVGGLLRGLASVVHELGAYAFFVKEELRELKCQVETLDSQVKTLDNRVKTLEGQLQYGDWAAAVFYLVGAKSKLAQLGNEHFLNESPDHWGCPAHRSILGDLASHNVSTGAFDQLWSIKKTRNNTALDGRKGGISLGNFELLFAKDFPQIYDSHYDYDTKQALKEGMGAVNKEFTKQKVAKAAKAKTAASFKTRRWAPRASH